MGRPNHPISIPDLARLFFLLNALIWLAFGLFTLLRLSPAAESQPATLWVVGILMFGNACAMLLAGSLIGRRKPLFFAFALAVLLVNILLAFTDQFGLADFLTLLLDLILIGLLILGKNTFLPSPATGGAYAQTCIRDTTHPVE